MSANQDLISRLQSDVQFYRTEVGTLRNNAQQLQQTNQQLVAEVQRLKIECYDSYRTKDMLQTELNALKNNSPPSPTPNQEKDFEINRLEQEINRLYQRIDAESVNFANLIEQIKLVWAQEDQLIFANLEEIRELKQRVENGGEDRRGLLDAIHERDTKILQQKIEIENLRETLLRTAKRKAA